MCVEHIVFEAFFWKHRHFVRVLRPRRRQEVGLFEKLVVYRLQQENIHAILMRIVYVEKCAKEAFDLLVVQTVKPRGMRHYEKPGFVRRKERFQSSIQAMQCAHLLVEEYLQGGWKLAAVDRPMECVVN